MKHPSPFLSFLLLPLLSLPAAALSSCDRGTSHYFERHTSEASSSPDLRRRATSNPQEYDPLRWHRDKPQANGVCATGQAQSPIDVQPGHNAVAIPGRRLRMRVADAPAGAPLDNLGHGLEVPANGTLELPWVASRLNNNNGTQNNSTTRNQSETRSYRLAQFHFHAPSEHWLAGAHYPMEVHFVWEAADKSLAVVGFPIDITCDAGAVDPLLAAALSAADAVARPGQETTTAPLDFAGLQRHLDAADVYQYTGSLTTPPCTEGIAWNVVAAPLLLDVETYRKARAVIGFNARHIQSDPGGVNVLESAMVGLEAMRAAG